MRYITARLKDNRYTTQDSWFKSFYGAFKTLDEAEKHTRAFNQQHEEDRRELAGRGMMLSD